MKERYNKKIEVHGLLTLPTDERDFSLAGFFDQINIDAIPQGNFRVSTPLKIKDQGNTDFCSAYAVTGVSEDQEGVLLIPEYQFFKTKQIMGNPDEWGADLRSACKSAVKHGSISEDDMPGITGTLTRYQVLDPNTWPSIYDAKALLHKKQAYFQVDGRYDMFDNIRTALYQNIKEERSIVVGAQWKQQWTDAPKGVIPKEVFDGGFGHAFKIFGQEIIEGEPYLVAQLSNSVHIGDGGIFYFPREVVNRELAPYGAFMFKDVARESVEEAISKAPVSWYAKLIDFFISNFNR